MWMFREGSKNGIIIIGFDGLVCRAMRKTHWKNQKYSLQRQSQRKTDKLNDPLVAGG